MLKRHILVLNLVWLIGLFLFPMPLVLMLNHVMVNTSGWQQLYVDAGLIAIHGGSLPYGLLLVQLG